MISVESVSQSATSPFGHGINLTRGPVVGRVLGRVRRKVDPRSASASGPVIIPGGSISACLLT